MNYYLYIDDSAKFNKKNDKYVIYSYILISKEQRNIIEKKYIKSWCKITNSFFSYKINDLENNDLENFYQSYKNSNIIHKMNLLSGALKEEPKGNDLISKYNRSIKNNDKDKINIEEFLNIYSNTKIAGTIGWCKECSVNKNKNDWNTDDKVINKKKYMILCIIKKLLDINQLKMNDTLKIYVDNEFTGYNNIYLNSYFKSYLNTPIKTWDDFAFTGYPTPKMIYKIRKNNIQILNFEFLDSELSIFIRMADILANMSHKMINKKDLNWVNSYENIYNFLTKNVNLNFYWLFFPTFSSSINLDDAKCNHQNV